jgi:hypothetical protein
MFYDKINSKSSLPKKLTVIRVAHGENSHFVANPAFPFQQKQAFLSNRQPQRPDKF